MALPYQKIRRGECSEPGSRQFSLAGSRASVQAPTTGRIHADCHRIERPAPRGHVSRIARRHLPIKLSIPQRDGMKALLDPADIHADDNVRRHLYRPGAGTVADIFRQRSSE
jgi:hypothetical protein